MAGNKEKDAPSKYRFLRPFGYGFAFFLVFCLTAAELGIVSHLLHEGGNIPANYPTREFKSILGLILFSCIGTFLYVFSHPWSSMGISAFWSFVFAVFWGTSAGVIFHVSPFENFTCHRPASSFPPAWQSYHDRCHEVVALQGMAWALWGIFIFKFLGMIIELIEFKKRPNVKSFYQV
ncbi:hypothetical protein EW026_g3776 [Hermanssonia centrifuga]|uniref:Uncharacterized protein n=2 Tax=Hermanssonia centrifuga TaxID=98765 RepID=A0A2R6NZD5_9APHY|nr:hypothetical protein PHLCEN_2v6515 [Hermanssonia centrifuga]THG98398.1 hypothetical protein EW026_g3776 [Hermanssonia centrifuga]